MYIRRPTRLSRLKGYWGCKGRYRKRAAPRVADLPKGLCYVNVSDVCRVRGASRSLEVCDVGGGRKKAILTRALSSDTPYTL